MFSKAISRIVSAFAKAGAGPEAMEAAQAIGAPEQRLEHKGTLAILGNLDTVDRKFSTRSGAGNLKPSPPVAEAPVARGLLELTNAPNGLSDRRGENGYALKISAGVLRNEGESQILRHAKIDSTGEVVDARTTELPAGVDTSYYYADGYECSDGKGRDSGTVPIRVFYPEKATLPVEHDVVSYARDLHGLAWGVGGGGGRLRWAKGSTEWKWESGYEGAVGTAAFIDVDDIYGANAGATTTRIYMRSGPGIDPNVHVDDIVGWRADEDGLRIAITASAYDEKIGSTKQWDLAVASIPAGWALNTTVASKFMVGYEAGGDYDPPGSTGGLHPITDVPADTCFVVDAVGGWSVETEKAEGSGETGTTDGHKHDVLVAPTEYVWRTPGGQQVRTDFRPPFASVVVITRVGPDDD